MGRPSSVQRRAARLEGVGVRRRNPCSLLHPLARALSGRRRGRPHRRPYRPRAHLARRLRRAGPRGPTLRRQEPASACSKATRPPAGPTARCTSSGIAATSPSPAAPSPRGRRPTSSCAASLSRRPQGPAARALRHGARPARAAECRQGAPRRRFQDVRRLQGLVQRRRLHPRIRSRRGSRWAARAKTPRF